MFGKVLVIAINEYGGRNRLSGCLNDAEDLYETLVKTVGYDPRNIRYLANNKATAKGILDSLTWMCDAESAFCYYSGHGGLTNDRHPALVSVDMQFLPDREIAGCLGKKPALLVYDCCHSGSIPVDKLDGSLRNSNFREPEARIRYIHNPALPPGAEADMSERCAGARVLATDLHLTNSDMIYFSGCRDCETSKEVGVEGKSRGLLSYNFCRILGENPEITIRELWSRTSESIEDYLVKRGIIQTMGEQHPQLWCRETFLDQKFFGVLA